VTERRSVGHTGTTCGSCGRQSLVPTELRLIRRGFSRLSLRFDGQPQMYELCEGCDAEHAVEPVA
jgi:hypothetical protein